jgi:tetratricopeptide (TPR) repeat protein
VTIPSTIQDVIMARVDALPEGAKELLQSGSVIEREFNYELIKQISGLSEQELWSQLSVLKDAEVIFERGIYPESTYIFKHALTQEVVYDSILTRKKKELHNKIGQIIEHLYKDYLHEHYGVLAEHFISSENYEKGAKYCRLVGKKAEKAGALTDAIAFGYKEVSCLERLLQTDEVEKYLIDARTKVGSYYCQMGYPAKAKLAIDPITELALNRNYKKRISPIYFILGFYKGGSDEDFPKAMDYANKALKIGEGLNDLSSITLSNTMMGVIQLNSLEFAKALDYFNKALEVNVAVNVLWGISALKAWITIVNIFQGKIKNGYETSGEASRLADESGDVYSKSHSYTAHGWSAYCRGYLKDAEKYLLKVAEIPESINHLWFGGWAFSLLGKIYFDTQEYEISNKHYERAISLYRHGSLWPSWVNYWKMLLLLAKVMNNEKDINLNEVFQYYEDNKHKSLEGSMQSCICEILLNINNLHMTEAEDWIKKAIEANKRNGMMWNLASDYALYAELFKRKGETLKAKENLSRAIEMFKECGADGWVEKYEKELTALQ